MEEYVPPIGESVLIIYEAGLELEVSIVIGRRVRDEDGTFFQSTDHAAGEIPSDIPLEYITHWMKLPDPPQRDV